jgi:inhibitor of cysteine peptidase
MKGVQGMGPRLFLSGTGSIVLMVAAVLGTGCQPSTEAPAGEVRLDEKADGTTVVLAQGQPLVIILASNPTTGYSWAVSAVDSTILRVSGASEFSPSSPQEPQRVGAGGTETFRFSPNQPGTTVLHLIYRRPWEEGTEPAKQFRMVVTVR